MGVPHKLKNFIAFGDGQRWIGDVSEVTVPKIVAVTEDWRAGGMLGAAKIDLGIEPMTCEWTAGGMIIQAIRQMGQNAIDGTQLRFVGAFQDDSTGQVMQVEISMRGRHNELDMGSWKAGSDTEHKFKTDLTYYKLTVNGFVEYEIDIFGLIYNVGGVDRYKEIREALGMSGGASLSIGLSL